MSLSVDHLKKAALILVKDELLKFTELLIQEGINEKLLRKKLKEYCSDLEFNEDSIITNNNDLIIRKKKFLKPNIVVEDKLIATREIEQEELIENGPLTLIMNYGDKSHALIGDFTNYSEFEDKYLRITSGIYYNPRLTYGSGYIITKKCLPLIEKMMITLNIKYEKIERSNMKKNNK